jgi:hypothetical protein
VFEIVSAFVLGEQIEHMSPEIGQLLGDQEDPILGEKDSIFESRMFKKNPLQFHESQGVTCFHNVQRELDAAESKS